MTAPGPAGLAAATPADPGSASRVTPRRPLPTGLAFAGYVLAALAMLWVTRTNNFGVHGRGSAFWPVIGVYFGAALICRRRLLPVLALASLAVWMAFPILSGRPYSDAFRTAVSWLGNSVAVFAGALVYRRFCGPDSAPGRGPSSRALHLFLLVTVCVPALSATAMKAIGWALHVEPFSASSWVSFFEADGLGILVVAPFILALAEPGPWQAAATSWRGAGRSALILLVVLAAALLLFARPFLPSVVARPFMIFPCLVVAAFQGQRLLSATATFIVTLVVVVATSHGYGPFAESGQRIEVIIGEMQVYIATTTLMAMLLTDAVIARRTLAAELQLMMMTKEQLLMDVSHELKSPLARMKMAVSFLKDAKMQAHLARDVNGMERMVAEILESARLQSPHGTIHREQTDVADAVRAALLPYEAQRPGIVLSAPPALTAEVDRNGLAIVARNVVDNALRYSEPGGPAVEVRLSSDGRAMTLTVRDFGIGIPKADIPHLFEPFYRVDRSRSKATGGHGLGLSLCHRIVSAHGGTIHVTSEHKGTEVTVVLPL